MRVGRGAWRYRAAVIGSKRFDEAYWHPVDRGRCKADWSYVSGTHLVKALSEGNPALTGRRALALGGAWVLDGTPFG